VSAPSQLEAKVRALLEAQQLEQAAVLVVRTYGPEILGFLGAQLRSDQHADDVFAMFAEDLWKALPGLTLHTSMRAYAYALARNAAHRYVSRQLKPARRGVPLSQAAALEGAVAEARTGTAPYVATGNKRKLEALRERLSQDEQALLTLRVDRGMTFAEIAEVLEEPGLEPKRSARLRKRFELVKEKLRVLAVAEGLLDDAPG
jgi:RNA polymerase sigma-70 factor, ECF subfamily